MNEFKVLWIDDHWEQKNNKREHASISSIRNDIIKDNPNVVIDTMDTIASGVVAFFHNVNFNYNLLIVDLHFDNEKANLTVNFICEKAKEKSLPVIVFSSFVDDVNVIIKDFVSSPLLLGCFSKGNKLSFIEAVLNAAKFRALNVVHISDFHFDSALTGDYYIEQNARFEELVRLLIEENKKWKIDLIVFSGDFAYKHPKEDFIQCFQFLQRIVNGTIKDFSKLLIIPGNHDIEWSDFDKAILAPKTGYHFYEFLKKVYSDDHEITSSLTGYNLNTKSFDPHFDPDSFCWSKTFTNLNVEIIGINTVTIEPALLGLGKVSDTVINYIKSTWANPPMGQNLRIAILHHNVLPPFSINSLSESKNILNAGQIINTLADYGCNIILSGHCHDSYLYNISYAILNHKGFSEMKHISYISTSTTGGYVGPLDRARSFNFISIIPSKEPKKKNILISPVLYDSNQRKWIRCEELSSEIIT
jgi:Calcineurin-like phosphoesterase